MRIRHLEIKRFRGIKELKWCVDGDIVCLIGPGDSTKTTILDAIELALSPRWNIPFDPSHPVRNAIETLDSVEVVRTIREALKK